MGRHGPFPVVRVDDGEFTRLIGSARLVDLVEAAGVRRGDEIGVAFTGWDGLIGAREFDLYLRSE